MHKYQSVYSKATDLLFRKKGIMKIYTIEELINDQIKKGHYGYFKTNKKVRW